MTGQLPSEHPIPASPAVLDGQAAARLFAERAGAIAPEFALTDENAPIVAEICRRRQSRHWPVVELRH